MFSMTYKNIILAIILITLYIIECIFPYFEDWNYKAKHAIRNGGIILFNAVIINILLAPVILLSANTPWGLFNQQTISPILEVVATIVLIDFLTYIMHVLFHKIPFLWKFHRMHHSDTQMDVTTGARFHIGEHFISICARSVLYAVFAMKLEYILIYETLFVANVLFHHANISISEPIDRLYRIFFTSPNMHKVHHSNKQQEADSNYTSLLSIWDRLFGTYTIVKNPKSIVYGVKGLEQEQTVKKMLLTPFKKK